MDIPSMVHSNILNRKEVVKEIPPYFKNQSVPIVSYSYTNSIGRKIVNYKEALQDINIEECLRSCTRDLIVLTQSEKDSNSGSWFTSLFIHLLA
jgi:hypothetical protein